MNILEKILKEIEERKKAYHMYSKEVDMIAMLDIRQRMRELNCVEKIIRSHMDEVKNDDWIPVEERLPEEDERYKGRKVIDVLVTTAKGKATKVQRQSHNGYWWWGRIYGEPTAWQPLPEPYKGGEE